MKDIETKQRFIELRGLGKSYSEISAELKISKTTLIKWRKDLDSEIANNRAIEIDALHRRYKLNLEARIEIFGSILERLREEISTRSLSGLSTKDILDQLGKISSNLNKDLSDLTFGDETLFFASKWPV